MSLVLEGHTDRDLLDRYVLDREEPAFAELVDRHADAVRRVCRGILHDHHASDEVVQDTFLLLARKAGVIPWHQSVGKWLKAAAYRLAQKRRCALARRRHIEQCIPLPTQSASDGTIGDVSSFNDPLSLLATRELHGALNDEVKSLPPRYRAPLQLCYLEGKTNRQAADVLGWPQGSIARRLARARAILQQKLVLRGFVVASLAFLAAGLWLTLGSRSERTQDIRTMMALFRSTNGRADFETVLADLAAGKGDANADVLALAQQTAGLAERMSEQGTSAWKRHSQAMGESARQLASAIEAKDATAVANAAGRLRNSCVQCHLSNREASRERERPEERHDDSTVLRSLTLPARKVTHARVHGGLIHGVLTPPARQFTLLRELAPPHHDDCCLPRWTVSLYNESKRGLANA